MFEAKATWKYARISPRKARLVADMIRGRDYLDAKDYLKYTPKKAARMIYKVLESAHANAKVLNEDIADKNLYVYKVYVDEGPIYYRWRARARGRGMRIRKRTSHITIVLGEGEE